MVGGVCINTGTIPSKTLREAVMYLTGMSQRAVYGAGYRVKDDITIDDLFARTHHVIDREIDVIRNQLARNHVTLIIGDGALRRPAHDRRRGSARPRSRGMTADNDRHRRPARAPHRPKDVDVRRRDDPRLRRHPAARPHPATIVVVGAGVIGIEYASMFAALGTKVTVVEQRQRLLEFCDAQIVEALQYHLRDLGVTFRFGESVVGVERHDDGTVTDARQRQAHPGRGRALRRRPAGRDGRRSTWRTPGSQADERGRIEVDDRYRTEVEHIYAAGDVIGFPASPRPPWSRAASPRATRSASPAARWATCCRSASTRSPRSASSAAPRRS